MELLFTLFYIIVFDNNCSTSNYQGGKCKKNYLIRLAKEKFIRKLFHH
jgi:hypothetical protein